MKKTERLAQTAALVRSHILVSTTEAGSGHPTSSLSATDLMTCLFFGGILRFDVSAPAHPNNDRVIFSKGHAAPLLYALWAAAGAVSDQELLSLRKFGSRLEGHPTAAFPYAEAATGSLGQGLSIGVGMALNGKYMDKLPYTTYVLLGDSEMAEGSQWEAIQIAAHYRLDNLVAVLDVNRLGQRGETMYAHDLDAYRKRVSAFGWRTILLQDGHDHAAIMKAYRAAARAEGRPVMIIARTMKGKGVSFIEDRNGWHGKALSREELGRALTEIGETATLKKLKIKKPDNLAPSGTLPAPIPPPSYSPGSLIATRKAYGNALVRVRPAFPDMVVLDAEVSNSTYAEIFRARVPERYFEMFVAEQNMAGAALGLARRGKIPFMSSFAAFLSRAFDQIRMSQYSDANIKVCGSHAGVSIGEDGASQMGLEDLALFRAIHGSVVLYPSDGVSTERLVEEMARHRGIVYLRTTRKETPVLYPPDEQFPIGGAKVLRKSDNDRITVVAAGITLHEALGAADELSRRGINVRVIDLYSVKPLDVDLLKQAAAETKTILTVEDHFPEGGIGEAVAAALSTDGMQVHSLAVRKMPRSGKPEELLDYEEISHKSIVRKIESLSSII